MSWNESDCNPLACRVWGMSQVRRNGEVICRAVVEEESSEGWILVAAIGYEHIMTLASLCG